MPDLKRMKNFIERNGFSLFDLLFVVIVTAIVAAIAIPSLIASRQAEENRAAITALRSIQAAQFAYRSKLGGNTVFATFDALRAAGLLTGESPTGAGMVKNGFHINGSLNADATAFCVKAAPVLSSGETKYFGIDQKGILYQAASASGIECADGILTTGGGASMVFK